MAQPLLPRHRLAAILLAVLAPQDFGCEDACPIIPIYGRLSRPRVTRPG